MVFELVHAHAESGLLKGSKGFCPVAVTEGLTSKRVKPLHDLARKQVIHAAESRKAGGEGNFYSYFPIKLDDKKFDLLTRGDCITDATRSKIKFVVHQILVDHDENDWDCGPASVLAREDLWVTRWSTKPQLLKVRKFEMPPLSPRVCNTWEKMTRDSGWAGVPAEAFEKRNSIMVLANESIESKSVLELFVESASLLKKQFRWDIPFTIRAWHPFGEDRPFWNVVDAGTQQAIDSLHQENVIRIDLTHSMPRATGKYANDARSGNWVDLDVVKKSSINLTEEAEEEIKLAPADELVAGSFVMSGSSTKLASVSAIRKQEDIDKAIAEQKRVKARAGVRTGRTTAFRTSEEPDAKSQTAKSDDENGKQSVDPKKTLEKQKKPTTSNDHVLTTGTTANAEPSWLVKNKNSLIRWGTGLAAVIVVGTIIWAGIGFIQQAFSLADDMGSKGVTIIGRGEEKEELVDGSESPKDEEATSEDNDSDVNSSSTPSESSPEKPIRPSATLTDFKNKFRSPGTLAPYIDVKQGSTEPQSLFSWTTPLPGVSNLISAKLVFGDLRRPLSWNSKGNQLSVTVPAADGPIEVAIIKFVEVKKSIPNDSDSDSDDLTQTTNAKQTDGSKTVPSEGGSGPEATTYETRATWQWTNAAESQKTRVLEILAGQLHLNLNGQNMTLATNLAAPQESPKFTISDAAFGKMSIRPHLAEVLATKEGFSKYYWEVRKLVMIPDQAANSVWSSSVRRDRITFRLSDDYVRQEAEKLLKVDLSSGRIAEVFSNQLRFHGPLAISAEVKILNGDLTDSELELNLESEFNFRSISEHIVRIPFADAPGLGANSAYDRKTAALGDHLAKKLMEITQVKGKQGYRIITKEGEGARKAPNNSQKCSVAIAAIFYEAAMEMLERDLQIEVIRRSKGFRFESQVLLIPQLENSTAE